MGLSRRILLAAAANRGVTRLVTRYGMGLGAARFVAGETLVEAIAAVEQLNGRGIKATLDHLGESVQAEEEAREAAQAYLDLLEGIHASGVEANVSLKLTQMGLDIREDLCLDLVETIVQRAAAHGNFVRIDMEDSSHLPATKAVFKDLLGRYSNVGLVLQAYLYRTQADMVELSRLGANLRLVKGAYAEPPEVAFPSKADVDRNFAHLIEARLRSPHLYTAVATHDQRIIEHTRQFALREGIPNSRFEFQMLYGVASRLQQELAARRHTVRVYVPYGRHWYPYFVRRLAERPANMLFFLRSLLRG